ncbi:MAG TPA: methylated-DNA--[protein]-cysteine S-methyltransferase [Candidatus Omnitrophota bacterium]|nr:methylated-DNA--[protein]-cysteine S-methyltransferase [Candidatus Omnitrophota bacterium]HPT07077.1 methylated-DNA--[protein]-cysteine S-methyltransferase [Candidatus Omnitrophota bacterium]
MIRHTKRVRPAPPMITPFEKKVYTAVMTIPLGSVRTYAWVACRIGKPKAVRAVGQALHKNPFPLLIPCHRVVRSNGKLGGFAWGVRNKAKLLNLERQIRQLMV